MDSELYFHLRDELYKQGGTGYTRAEIHQLAKETILPMLYEQDKCWVSDDRTTTKSLSPYGWELFIEQFKCMSVNIHYL